MQTILKLFYAVLFFIGFSLRSFSQIPISLKEVRVFPDDFAISLIKKMKVETKRNLSKEFLNFNIYVEAMKNSKDTVIHINQNGKFQLKALHNRNYKFEEMQGKIFYDNSFFTKYEYTRLLKYWSFYGTLNRLFELDGYKFFKNFNEYKYQVSIKDNCYLVSFTSDTYSGYFSVDTLTSNLLHLNFSLIKPL